MKLQVGDLIVTEAKKWPYLEHKMLRNGYLKGVKNGKLQSFPAFKVERAVNWVPLDIN